MAEGAAALAARFEDVVERFAAEVAGLSPAQWVQLVPAEARTVAALVHHVAVVCLIEIASFQAIADDRPAEPFTWSDIDHANADHARTYAACDQAETVSLLRRNAAAAATVVRSLSDEQLARRGDYIVGLPSLSVATWIDRVLIGHVEQHRAAMWAALGRAADEE